MIEMTRKLAKIMMWIITCIVLSFSMLMMPKYSYATNAVGHDSAGYGSILMGGDGTDDGTPWDEDVITSSEDYNDQGDSSPEGIVDIFQNFVYSTGTWMVCFLILLAGTRLAWRGVYELVFRQSKNDINMPFFLMTGAERDNGKPNTEWVIPLLKETAIYLGIGVFIFTIFGIIIAFVSFAFTSLDPF